MSMQRPAGVGNSERGSTNRRRFIAGTAVGAAAAWIAPAILSVDAASANSSFPLRLFGVTGDGGPSPQSLFELNPATGAATLVVTSPVQPFQGVVVNVTSGEALATLGGKLFRLSGRVPAAQVLNDVTVPGFVIGTTAASGAAYEEPGGLTASGAGFLMAESVNAGGTQSLFSMTTGGVVTLIGPIDALRTKGLAFNLAGTTLFAVDSASPALRTINPATGGVTGTTPMTSGLGAIIGGFGLATQPIFGVLYVLLRFAAGARRLSTVDPATGITTDIGPADNGSGLQFAGIAWR